MADDKHNGGQNLFDKLLAEIMQVATTASSWDLAAGYWPGTCQSFLCCEPVAAEPPTFDQSAGKKEANMASWEARVLRRLLSRDLLRQGTSLKQAARVRPILLQLAQPDQPPRFGPVPLPRRPLGGPRGGSGLRIAHSAWLPAVERQIVQARLVETVVIIIVWHLDEVLIDLCSLDLARWSRMSALLYLT
jgi:hypothetical protein